MKGYTTIEAGTIASKSSLAPVVSVIVPTFNAAKTLDQALDSLETQTLTNLEILVINDGSTDDSLAIARAHEARDGRIRVIDRPNGGYGSACNRGIDEARGTWVAILEPDDWVEPAMYKSMVDFAKVFSEPIDIVKTPYWRVVDPDTSSQHRLNCSYRHRVPLAPMPFTIEAAPHLLRHHPSIWSAIYRRSFLNENQIRFPEYPGAGWADNPFLVETLCQAKAIAYLDVPFYNYREETDEEHAGFVARTRTMALDRWQAMMDVLERLGIDNPTVMAAMVRRGFTYLNGILDSLGTSIDEQPDIKEAATAMVNRMNSDLVLNYQDLSPSSKALYCELRGLELPPQSKAAYMASLAREGLYTLRNNGPKYTWKMISSLRS